MFWRVSSLVSQTRAKAPLEFFQDIVMKSGAKLSSQAEIQIANPSAVHTPFAVKQLNTEIEWAKT